MLSAYNVICCNFKKNINDATKNKTKYNTIPAKEGLGPNNTNKKNITVYNLIKYLCLTLKNLTLSSKHIPFQYLISLKGIKTS